jgi:beta-lactamase class A
VVQLISMRSVATSLVLVLALVLVATCACSGDRPPPPPPPATTLQGQLDQIAARALHDYAARGLLPDSLALVAVRLRADGTTEWAQVNGDLPMYPASVVKLFYLVALHAAFDDGRIVETPELDRATTDMIVDSGNDPTNYLLEVLTGASGGAELPEAELQAWMEQRQAVNKYFQALGYTHVNASQKTWAEGPYGRERQGYGPNFELRNSASANAIAKLWIEQLIQPKGARADARRALLARDFTATNTGPDDMRTAFTGKALPAGARLWSKSGWTSKVRHDSAYVELPTGEKIVWVILTQGVSGEKALIPTVSGWLFAWFNSAR